MQKFIPNPKFQVYKDAASKYRWRLVAANGNHIAFGEAYFSKESCLNGIASVKANVSAPIEDLTNKVL